MRLFGIKNCDTVKKARKWLEEHEFPYEFHDFRENGLDAKMLKRWEKQVGIDVLINRRSTTWKQLQAEEKAVFDSAPFSADAIQLICQQPTLIKRPLIETDTEIVVGFDAKKYQSFIK